jgi:hypothetical protein
MTSIGRRPILVSQHYRGLSVPMDIGKKETLEVIRRNGMEGIPSYQLVKVQTGL